MSEWVIHAICLLLGYIIGYGWACWQFEGLIRVVAEMYEDGNVQKLLGKIKEWRS